MRLARFPHEPGAMADFYQETLEHLGAVCERTWFDRLQLVAEGPAATPWNPDGAFLETELTFGAASGETPRDPARDVFPGCPLTFRLAEALLTLPLTLDRVLLGPAPSATPPSPQVAEKLWRGQWPGDRSWRLHSAFKPTFHFSVLGLVRCEIQAIEQHWSLHRIAVSHPSGEADPALASNLELEPVSTTVPDDVPWPRIHPGELRNILLNALASDLEHSLTTLRQRQQAYLRRELTRIDAYFSGYAHELTERARRQRGTDSRTKTDQRLAAARAEHARRREDQVQRHEIRVLPRFDALLLVAEPAWSCEVAHGARTGEEIESAHFVPRIRRWFHTTATALTTPSPGDPDRSGTSVPAPAARPG